jgi:23S rRNA (uracil1939-C5)-methyltransferase
LTLELTGFAPGGKAVAHAPDGRVVFVEYGIPGERVVAEVVEEHSSYIEATTVAVERASPARVEPRCEYFGRCGGCQLQHVDYAEQLRLKTGVVREQLARIGRFEEAEIDGVLSEMIGMQHPWAYRNHMRFTVRRDGEVGFMQRGTHRFLRIDRCEIAVDRVNELLSLTQGRTMQTRQLAVRVGENTGDELIQPHLSWRPSARGPRPRSGQRRYTETLLGQPYRISAAAFFQVNSRQAERLLQLVIERVEAIRPRVVVDAYAGVGTFAAQLSRSVETVVTIEESAAAGSDAELNLGDLQNVRRVIGKVEGTLPGLRPSPDVVVIDPPRAGLAPGVTEAIRASKARRVVYVSCDPATLARDLRVLVDGGFTLTEVQPVDMFPHTQHIECVTVLDRTALPA